MSIDQIVLLGGDSGYMVVCKDNAFAPTEHPNFPISEKTIQVSRSNGMPDGTWPVSIPTQGGVLHWFGFNTQNLYRFPTKGKELYSTTGEIEDSNVSIGGAKDLPWDAVLMGSVVGTVKNKYLNL